MPNPNTSIETSFAMYQVTQPAGAPSGANAGLLAYFVESTAPTNVNIGFTPDQIPALTPVEPQAGIDKIAAHLAARVNAGADAEVVVTVHGFSNPMNIVLGRYAAAFKFVDGDATILSEGKGLVCIGYRWPSESIGQPFGTFWDAAPPFLKTLFWAGIALLIAAGLLTAGIHAGLPLPQVVRATFGIVRATVYCLGLIVLAIPFAVLLERTVSYFRDGYRAVQYGVPDLVEVVRQIDNATDNALAALGVDRSNGRRVGLSFIGHSMGAYVVTSVVRILTDVFSAPSIAPLSAQGPGAAATGDTPLDSEIGKTLALGRLVLVAPDIPAEALLTCRANFLRSSLRRFEEAYIFSNAGDIVLRLISTVANSFSFPTTSSRYGYRLGNTQVLWPGNVAFGLIRPADYAALVRGLVVGVSTLEYLQGEISKHESATLTRAKIGGAAGAAVSDSRLPMKFTYFDCTDYRDVAKGGQAPVNLAPAMVGVPVAQNKNWRAYLSFATGAGRLSQGTLLALLGQYVNPWNSDKIDVHSGYFDGYFTQALIYRLACLGWDRALCADDFGGTAPAGGAGAAVKNEPLFGVACAQHGITMLRP